MVFKKTIVISIFLFIFLMSPSVEAGVTDDILPYVIFLMQDVESGQNANIGSGLLVSKDDSTYVVTANHVALKIGNTFVAILPRRDGHSDKVKLAGIQWNKSIEADVAITKIEVNNQRHTEIILKRSLPFRLLTARPLPPSRDITLTVMGYPLGLGATGYVSPLSIETKAASGFITLNRFDNGNPATFILLQDPSISGLSGGPVFDTGLTFFSGGRKMTVREGVSVVGIIHGVI